MAGKRLNLVVLDDDPAIVRLATTVIEQKLADKFSVVSFTDPLDGRQWIEMNHCHVLLTDIDMPSLTGMQVLQLAKRHNPWSQVILMTAHSTWSLLAEAIERGVSDYLLKPLDQNELIAMLEHEYTRLQRWQAAVLNTFNRPRWKSENDDVPAPAI